MSNMPRKPAAEITVDQLLARGARALQRAGVQCLQGTADFRDEAAMIIWHELGLDHDDPGAGQQPVTAAAQARCEALLQRRAAERIPAAYLLGEAWFCGLPFHVDQRVLIPRSPFAELVEARFAPWADPGPAPRILEIGTGSGCIAIACALAFPGAEVLATDISADALAVAAANVARHGVGARLRLLQADLYDGVEGRFDLIVSNPPYVPESDLQVMPPELAWEPRSALAGGGADGLDLVRRIIAGAPTHLRPGGWLAVEVGAGMAALERAFPQLAFVWPEFERGGDGIALVAAGDLPEDNDAPGATAPGH
ncbi:MAG: release factor glutamine methyltransferase [Gammaproteobacteria bacterium]|nr:MAG: 50S ribosomal protein L3 N(5)-glutamine methyltransferase [Pseudomonadota bacterium]MBC6945315.1 50S ribosomal protein L3 N(5)-glutamine methyltransferase [Gammaproteobacteria bacterium]MCE7895502.1 50S ribosomal protein L3 N(5)-glutamine methyltransferase [Gammaproteobacteria bacterium PRO8]MDL1880551.1 50S ribosomal protein L3 N(5)-glutamine methyltransferase [Gammaproteobacteria bacterium PRO2]MCL4777711.1 50S ribosomal protein L3 N(5)-glutamine methyltransferase [Gammaproteobacteria